MNKLLLLILACASPLPVFAQKVKVDQVEAGCWGVITAPVPGCWIPTMNRAYFEYAERDTTGSVQNPGTPVPIIEIDDEYLDNCTGDVAQKKNTTEVDKEFFCVVTINYSGNVSATVAQVLKLKIEGSIQYKDQQEIQVKLPAQAVDVPARSAKKYDALINSVTGKTATAEVKYSCSYKIPRLEPDPCNGYTAGDLIVRQVPGALTASCSATTFDGSAYLEIADATCPCPKK